MPRPSGVKFNKNPTFYHWADGMVFVPAFFLGSTLVIYNVDGFPTKKNVLLFGFIEIFLHFKDVMVL